jgi:hypothetical protein
MAAAAAQNAEIWFQPPFPACGKIKHSQPEGDKGRRDPFSVSWNFC